MRGARERFPVEIICKGKREIILSHEQKLLEIIKFDRCTRGIGEEGGGAEIGEFVCQTRESLSLISDDIRGD